MMNNKWLKLFLLASIAFNLAFVANGLYRKDPREKEPKEKRKVTPPYERQLELRDEQKKEIKKIMKTFRMNMLESKQDILDKRIAIVEAMSDADSDEEDIKSRTAELNELENRLNLVFVNSLIEINKILDAQQRLNFLVKLSKNWFFIKNKRRRSSRSSQSLPSKGGRHD
ncbi:MAG: periplasmic heavy metal sensor [bacterium]|nr:periplasmic heavy metal sensor [bacterium]